VCKIKCEGKVLSPVEVRFELVGVSVNECTAQMADTMELVRVWYCMTDVTYVTYSVPCVGLLFSHHIAALIFAQVHMEFVIVCFCDIEHLGSHSNDDHESCLCRIFRKYVENLKFYKFNKFDKNNECLT
jgi:hypothetical protein